MSNINKQALRGQSVEGSYYLAECGHCGEMYPSNKLDGGESLFSGDYGECFCHLCGADDSDIADNGAWGSEAVTAWNYQQKRIEALLDENYRLTAERDALRENIGGDNTRAAADIYFQLVEEYEIPPGGSLVGYIDDIKERLGNSENHSSELDNALCELLPGTQYMDPPDGGSVTPLEQVRRMVADYRGRIEELESRTVNLPEALNSYAGVKIYRPNDVIEAIRAAGIGVKGVGEVTDKSPLERLQAANNENRQMVMVSVGTLKAARREILSHVAANGKGVMTDIVLNQINAVIGKG